MFADFLYAGDMNKTRRWPVLSDMGRSILKGFTVVFLPKNDGVHHHTLCRINRTLVALKPCKAESLQCLGLSKIFWAVSSNLPSIPLMELTQHWWGTYLSPRSLERWRLCTDSRWCWSSKTLTWTNLTTPLTSVWYNSKAFKVKALHNRLYRYYGPDVTAISEDVMERKASTPVACPVSTF